MLFNSVAFLIFFPIVTFVYWVLPHRFRWFALLIASYYFYMSWNPSLVFLIAGTTLISYLGGLIIERSARPWVRKTALAVTVTTCLLVLFFFKYFNFLSESVVALLRKFGLPASDFSLNVLLPVGISFYTFQTLSYAIDVYRGKISAEKHIGYYALFVSFFPQLVAGPIERPENLLPQLRAEHKFDGSNLSIGLRYMLIGFFKKIVVADTIAVAVNGVYNSLDTANGFTVALATVLFALQILCDFDGYTNIAIGAAKLMGIDLVKNFDKPYGARSIKEFWARWHISLSTWLRDYVYIPLGGNRCSKPRHMFNLFVTFLLSGLWHGAAWTFVIWGALHGVYQIIGNLTAAPRRKMREKLGLEQSQAWKLVQRAFTFGLVCFSWIFFRANSLADAGVAIVKLFTDWSFSLAWVGTALQSIDLDLAALLSIALSALLLILLQKKITELDVFRADRSLYRAADVTDAVFYALLLAAVIFGWIAIATADGYANAFIYFQF